MFIDCGFLSTFDSVELYIAGKYTFVHFSSLIHYLMFSIIFHKTHTEGLQLPGVCTSLLSDMELDLLSKIVC